MSPEEGPGDEATLAVALGSDGSAASFLGGAKLKAPAINKQAMNELS